MKSTYSQGIVAHDLDGIDSVTITAPGREPVEMTGREFAELPEHMRQLRFDIDGCAPDSYVIAITGSVEVRGDDELLEHLRLGRTLTIALETGTEHETRIAARVGGRSWSIRTGEFGDVITHKITLKVG